MNARPKDDWVGRVHALATQEAFRNPQPGMMPVAEWPTEIDEPVLLFIVHRNALYEDDPAQRAEDWTQWVPGRWIDHNGGRWTWNGLCGLVTHVAPLEIANR